MVDVPLRHDDLLVGVTRPKTKKEVERDIRRMKRVVDLIAQMDDTDKMFLAGRLKAKEFRRWLE